MAFLDMFRVSKIKSDLEATSQERDQLKATLSTTEHMEHFELLRAIAELQEQKTKLEQEVQNISNSMEQTQRDIERNIADLKAQAEGRKKELIMLNDEILLQSFGFYKTRYEFQNSDAYRLRLEQIRRQQEDMIKAGKAANSPANWTLNNSLKEGERMIKDNVKLIVRSFNNECDASFVTVKFNNVESIEKKIRKAYDILNALGRRTQISLTPAYLDLKVHELYLCHEYQLKKQQEKEEQKRVREQLREDAKVAKEIEEMKLKIGKEERHFTKALETLTAQAQRATTQEEIALFERERALILQKLEEVERNKQDVLNRDQNTRAGYVYVISNVGAFGENIYKIGVTRRLDPQERIDELRDASVPFEFDTHALIFSDDAPRLEFALHKAFEKQRLNMINRRREFFDVSLAEIEEVVRVNFTKPVEFEELADAAEYRQSIMLRAGNTM